MVSMFRSHFALAMVLCAALALNAFGQQNPKPQPPLPPSDTVPRSGASQPNPDNNGEWKDDEGFTHRPDSGGFSSSKDEPVDLSPPPNDAKTHPDSAEAVHEAEDAAGLLEGDELGGIQEMHPWDPHKAEKDIEVGEYYFKQKNYRGALDRFQEALYYQYNNAVATFRVGECQEKLGESDEARKAYQSYLKLLPEGPFAAKAKQALERLGKADVDKDDKQNAPGLSQAQQPH
jgi:tetratricopeptide (TPR) repeat protein